MPVKRGNRKNEPCYCGGCRVCTPGEYEDEDIGAEWESWNHQRELREHDDEEEWRRVGTELGAHMGVSV